MTDWEGWNWADPVGRLVAADRIQEEEGQGAEFRATVLRDTVGAEWPKNVDPSRRFTADQLRRLRAQVEDIVTRYFGGTSVPIRVAEVVPGVVGVVCRDVARLVRTADVGAELVRVLSVALRDRAERIATMYGVGYHRYYPDDLEPAQSFAQLQRDGQ